MKLKLSSTQLMWVALYTNLHTVHEYSACVGTAFSTLRWTSAFLISEGKNYLKSNQVTSICILIKSFLLPLTEAERTMMHNKKALWKVRTSMFPNDSYFPHFLNCMWGERKIMPNQGFSPFIKLINIQQSSCMLGTNDLLSTEQSPALSDFAEACKTDLKRKKRKKKCPIRCNKVPRCFQN